MKIFIFQYIHQRSAKTISIIVKTLSIWKFFSQYDINGYNPIINTSTKEISVEELSVFPNPATTSVQIKGSITAPIPYRIINSTGQSCKSGTLTEQDQLIDLSELPADLYLLNTATQSIKILKIN